MAREKQRVICDVRSLLGGQPTGVGAYTESLLAGLAAIPSIEVVPFVTGRASIDAASSRDVTRYPVSNTLLNASLRFFGSPFLDVLAGGAETYILPNWKFVALSPETRLILVVHDLSFERNARWYGPRQRFFHRAVQPRQLVARADKIVAVSQWTKEELTSLYGTHPEKIVVIPPVASSPVVPAMMSLPERFLLFVGTIERRKNVPALLAAFAKLGARYPDLSLVLAGKPGYGSRDVARLLKSHPFAPRISWRGYVSDVERATLFARATAFVLPSFYEGFGIPVLDAMRADVPVIASNRSALPEVVGDAGVLIDPYDVASLVEGIDAVLGNDTFASELGVRGRVRAATFPETMTTALREIL